MKSDNFRLFSKDQDRTTNYIFFFALFSISALGVYFRLSGYAHRSLWYDEAWRANIISSRNWLDTVLNSRRAPSSLGYIFLNVIISRIYNTENTLRLTSLLPSIFNIYLLFLISKDLFKSKIVIVLAIFLISFNPQLIYFSKELKPFCFEITINLILIFFTLRAFKYNKNIYLYGLLIFIPLSVYFSPTIVFFLPGIFSILFYKYIRNRNWKIISFICISGATTLSSIFILYNLIYSKTNMRMLLNFWHDYFYDKTITQDSYIVFLIKRTASIIYRSTRLNLFLISHRMLRDISDGVFVILYVLSIVYIIKYKNYILLIMLISPLILLAIANLLKVWPYGYNRANLFITSITIITPLFSYDYMLRSKSRQLVFGTILFIFVFHLILQFPIVFSSYFRTVKEDMKSAIEFIYDTYTNNNDIYSNKNNMLVVNRHGYVIFTYYTQYNSKTKKRYEKFFKRKINVLHFEKRTEEYMYSTTKNILDSHVFDILWILFAHTPKEYELNGFFTALQHSKYYYLEKNFTESKVVIITD